MSDSIWSTKSSKSRDFARLREIITTSASRSPSFALSFISVDECDGLNDSVFHYDIRDADSLVEDYLAVDKNAPRNITGIHEIPHYVSSSSQTCSALEPAEVQELRNDLVLRLEGHLSSLEYSVSDNDEKSRRLLSRLAGYTIFEPVKGSVPDTLVRAGFYVAADSESIDVFQDATDITPAISISIGVSSVRVLARQRELLVMSGKTVKFIIYIDDVARFKKLLFTLKLLGVPISLRDVPNDMTSKLVEQQRSENPRRQSARDI